MKMKLYKLFALGSLSTLVLGAATTKKFNFKPESESTWENVSFSFPIHSHN